MKIGVTGSSGVLGCLLIEKLKGHNCQVNLFHGDIRDKNDVFTWLSEGFDILFHLAAKVPVYFVEKFPLEAYSVNVGGTINLLEGIKTCSKKPWLFFASSSHVYKSSNKPLSETSIIEPISLYGETKWFAERIISNTAESIGCSYCCGRIFSFYHNTQKKPFFYPTIIERLSKEDLSKPFSLYGANSVRDFVNAEDVVNIMVELMFRNAIGIVNIGSGVGIKIRDFVQQVSEKKLNIVCADDKEDYLVADNGKLNRIIGELKRDN